MNNSIKKYGIIGFIILLLIGAYVLFTNKGTNQIAPNIAKEDAVNQNLTPEDSITHGHGLAVDAADSSKVYIATHHGLLVLINDKDLYAVGKSNDDYMGFSPNPKIANEFFSSGHPQSGGNIGFQTSIDGGVTWKKISDGLDGPVDFHAMGVSSLNPKLIFGWYQGNLQRSSDGGKNWQKIPIEFVVVRLIADTANENIVYAASPHGLFISTNRGESWQRTLEGFVSTLAIHPADAKTMIVASEKLGLAKTLDKGLNWQKINQSFGGETVLFIAYDWQKHETLYILTDKNSLYKSQNGGEAWSKIR